MTNTVFQNALQATLEKMSSARRTAEAVTAREIEQRRPTTTPSERQPRTRQSSSARVPEL